MIEGSATVKGTSNYAKKFEWVYHSAPMFVSSLLALGTHLGNMDEKDSELYRKAISYALQNGINFIDTAINYRGMRSERDIGNVLKSLIEQNGVLTREEVIISTKGGIIPGDILANLWPKDYLKKVLLDNQVITYSDINVTGHQRHVLNPSYYQFAIRESQKHLNLQTIDIYYIHNPELSLIALGEKEFYKQLETLFAFMEEQVQAGHIRFYGLATWNALLLDPSETGYISIQKVIERAKSAAGENHHFRFIQFPLNKQMNAAAERKNQKVNTIWMSLIDAAKELEILATTSAPFNLGKDIEQGKEPQDALKSILTTKGIFSTMTGMKNVKHIKENICILRKEKA